MKSEAMVIDADGHILEPPDLWEKYLEPKYRDHIHAPWVMFEFKSRIEAREVICDYEDAHANLRGCGNRGLPSIYTAFQTSARARKQVRVLPVESSDQAHRVASIVLRRQPSSFSVTRWKIPSEGV